MIDSIGNNKGLFGAINKTLTPTAKLEVKVVSESDATSHPEDLDPNDHDMNVVGHLHSAKGYHAALSLIDNTGTADEHHSAIVDALTKAKEHHMKQAAEIVASGKCNYGLESHADIADDGHHNDLEDWHKRYQTKSFN